MNIVLFGFRGCGKTTLGRRLAGQLWKQFIDTDQEARKRFDGLSITEIWRTHGEEAFREAETEITCELMQRDELIVALGGGTLMQPKARQAVDLAVNAKCIYLSCQPQELYRRIAADENSRDDRPALTELGGVEEIHAVLQEREPVYRSVADAVFDVTHLNVDDAVRYLIKLCL